MENIHHKTREELIAETERLRILLADSDLKEQKYFMLFNRMIDGYALHEIICDEKGIPSDYRFIDINPAFETMTGLDRSIIGKRVLEVLPGLEPEWIKIYGKVALTGESVKFENYISTMDKWFEIIAFRPGPGQFACIFIEITERKKQENELRRLRGLLANIIDSMPSVLIGVTPEGRITHWNEKAAQTTGVSAANALGRLLTEILPHLEIQMHHVFDAVSRRATVKETKTPELHDNQIRFSDITIYPLISNGVEGAVIRIDDVTDRVYLEEIMIQSEKMMTVGGLAAGMAHEINNPLAGIMQNIQVMINRLRPEMKKNRTVAESCGASMDVIHDYMDKRGILTMISSVLESGKRAARIVQNMLDFSRKSNSQMAPCHISDLLDRTLELVSNDYDLKLKYDFRKIEIIRHYDPEIPLVPCEATKIQQVFLNILKNCAEAMASQHTSGYTPRFTLSISREPDLARIEIADNGPGMDESTRKRIFEPFFSTKTATGGVGLGMSISYFIITENHGGSLSVESQPGYGSRFIIHLPLEQRGGKH